MWNNNYYKEKTEKSTEGKIIAHEIVDKGKNLVHFSCFNCVDFVGNHNMFYKSPHKCNGCHLKCTIKEYHKNPENSKIKRGERLKRKIHETYNGHIKTDKLKYKDSTSNIILTCEKHGDFSVRVCNIKFDEHICPKCKREAMFEKRLEKFKDYIRDKCNPLLDIDSIKDYTGYDGTCSIKCKKHGYVKMKCHSVYKGTACPICVKENKSEEAISNNFKERFYERFGDKEYNVDDCHISQLSDIVVVHTKKFGDIEDMARNILSRRSYPVREYINYYRQYEIDRREKEKLYRKEKYEQHKKDVIDSAIERRLLKLNEHFDNKYKIEFVEDNWRKTKYVFRLFCEKHGWVEDSYEKLMNHERCPECDAEWDFITRKENYLSTCRKVHLGKYGYHDVIYTSKHDELKNIWCPIHGYFSMNAGNHRMGHGCPMCTMSSLEEKVFLKLEQEGIKNCYQYKNKNVLGLQSIDFFIADCNIGIECQGKQHYKAKGQFTNNNKDAYALQLKRDEAKRLKCQMVGIDLIYFSKDKYNDEYTIFTDLSEMVKYIRDKQSLIYENNTLNS